MTASKPRGSVPEPTIENLRIGDAEVISSAFAELGWDKLVTLFEKYFRNQESGTHVIFVAEVDLVFVGYVAVVWNPGYSSFADKGIPEISDLNVLPAFRRR